jgi:L-rhamnose isomerase
MRKFWVEHTKRCRDIADAMGKAQNDPCIMNVWVHDGCKDVSVNHYLYRETLRKSLDEIFADTKAVIATETLVEAKETANVLEAQRDLIVAENEMLKTKVSALTAEIDLISKELQHKEELLALHKYYQTHIEQLVKKEVI